MDAAGKRISYDVSIRARDAAKIVMVKFQLWLNSFYWEPLVLIGLVLLIFGGWSFVVWGILFPITFILYAIWMSTAATHAQGRRRFERSGLSRKDRRATRRNLEGTRHDYQRAKAGPARHVPLWSEIDVDVWGIRVMRILGITRTVTVVSLAQRLLG